MQDKRNKTGKPILKPEGMTDKEFEDSRSDVYTPEPNDVKSSGGRGTLPTEQYPCGQVKTKVWNENRPMRSVRTSVHSNRDHRNASS